MNVRFWFSLVFLFPAVFAYSQEPEYGNVESQIISEVIITSCRSGEVACVPNRSDLGCVPARLSGKARERACAQYRLALNDFDFECFLTSGGGRHRLGKTRSEETCQALQKVWDEISKDPFFTGKTEEWKMTFLRDTLLDPRKGLKRRNPGIAGQLQFKKSGKIKKNSDSAEELLERARENLTDYKRRGECGPGIVAGIDRVPVLNQKMQGTCYSHTAASLIDYVRKVRGGEGVASPSPLVATIDYYVNSDEEPNRECQNPFGGGEGCKSFNAMMQRGFCDTAKVEEAIRKSFRMDPKEWKSTAKDRSWFRGWYREAYSGWYIENQKSGQHPGPKPQGGTQVFFDEMEKKGDLVYAYLELIGRLYNKKDWERLREYYQSLKIQESKVDSFCEKDGSGKSLDLPWERIRLSSSLESFYASYFDGVCERKPFSHQALCISHGFFTKSSSAPPVSLLDGLLAKGYPVGISYCGGVLQNSRQESYHRPFSDRTCANKGYHESLLVGTARDSKGRCTYVIRNSWGRNCDFYDKSYDCKDGNIFIPKDLLLKQIFDVSEISVD